jgi:hypothetical protein
MVNNSININKVKNHVSSQLLEHKDNHSIIMELEIRVLAYINYILFEHGNHKQLIIHRDLSDIGVKNLSSHEFTAILIRVWYQKSDKTIKYYIKNILFVWLLTEEVYF